MYETVLRILVRTESYCRIRNFVSLFRILSFNLHDEKKGLNICIKKFTSGRYSILHFEEKNIFLSWFHQLKIMFYIKNKFRFSFILNLRIRIHIKIMRICNSVYKVHFQLLWSVVEI